MEAFLKYQHRIGRCQIVSSLIAILLFCIMPVKINGEETTGIQQIFKMVMGRQFQMNYSLVVIFFCVVVLHFIRCVLLLQKKKIKKLNYNYLEGGTFWGCGILFFVLAMVPKNSQYDPENTILFLYVYIILAVITFLYCRYQEMAEEKGMLGNR